MRAAAFYQDDSMPVDSISAGGASALGESCARQSPGQSEHGTTASRDETTLAPSRYASHSQRGHVSPSQFQNEIEIYRELAGAPGIPRVHWYGSDCEFRVMAFELLGPSLEELLNYSGR